VQPTNPSLAYEETVHTHYEALRRLGLGVDVLPLGAELSGYRVVVAPSLYLMDESTAAALAGYVQAGGLLVLTPRTGVKDRCNAVLERPMPGWLDGLLGLEVTDFMSVAPDDAVRIAGEDGALDGDLHGWYELLAPTTATALAMYSSGPFAGSPAITERELGEGKAVYVAGAAGATTLGRLYRLLCRRTGVTVLDVPSDVEAVRLAREDAELLVLLNHSDEERVVQLGPVDRRVHLGREAEDGVRIEPLGVALVEVETSQDAARRAVADRGA
jgi:beta-galactosidase